MVETNPLHQGVRKETSGRHNQRPFPNHSHAPPARHPQTQKVANTFPTRPRNLREHCLRIVKSFDLLRVCVLPRFQATVGE